MGAEGYLGLPAYYTQSSDPLTPNIGFSLWGMDPIIAENFVLADSAIESAGIRINGATVSNPNFNNITPSAPPGSTNVIWQVNGNNVSAYITLSGVDVFTVTNQSSTYSASPYDDVWCTGTFTITIPVLSNIQRVKVKNRGTGLITIVPTSGTIDGQSSLILSLQWSAVELAGDGTNLSVE